MSPGPKTAALAGIVGWLAFSVTGPAQFVPLDFYSNALLIKVGAFQLVTSIVATIAGAALYNEIVSTAKINRSAPDVFRCLREPQERQQR